MSRLRPIVVREVLFAGLAFLILVVVRTFVVDVYEVSGSSMEPTLWPGEAVLVDKLALRFRRPERFEPVVYDDPEEASRGSARRIKRVLGLPGEWIGFSGGDLELGTGDATLHVPVRTKSVLEAMLVPVFGATDRFRNAFEGTGSFPEQAGPRLTFAAGGGSRSFHFVGPGRRAGEERSDLRDWYRDRSGRWHGGRRIVRDIKVAIDIDVVDEGAALELEHEDDVSRAVVRVEGRAEGRARIRTILSPAGGAGDSGSRGFWRRAAGLPGGAVDVPLPVRLVWTSIDGRLSVTTEAPDGSGAERVFEGVRKRAPLLGKSTLTLTVVSGSVVLGALDIRRDIHYIPAPGTDSPATLARGIPAGRYFVVGDNSSMSLDSRSLGGIDQDRLVGYPVLVCWPADRIRALR